MQQNLLVQDFSIMAQDDMKIVYLEYELDSLVANTGKSVFLDHKIRFFL